MDPEDIDLLTDGTVCLRPWDVNDAEWYATTVTSDELIQRFTTESPAVTAEEVRSAIESLLAGPSNAAGFLVADAATGHRLGNIALRHDEDVGDVSYWIASDGRGRGVATRALRLFSAWAFATLRLTELRVSARRQCRQPRRGGEGGVHP